MNYTVSIKNQNDGTQTIVGWFTSKKKSLEFAEKLRKTGADNIQVWNETRKELIFLHNEEYEKEIAEYKRCIEDPKYFATEKCLVMTPDGLEKIKEN